MKRYFGGAVAVALAGVLISLVHAQPGNVQHKHIQGHTVLPHEKIQKLPDGVHHFHTTQTGHQLHAQVHQGKLAGLHVKDPKGRALPVKKRTQKKHRASVDEAGDVVPVAWDGVDSDSGDVLPVQDVQILIGFGYFDAYDNCWVWIWFPAHVIDPNVVNSPDDA